LGVAALLEALQGDDERVLADIFGVGWYGESSERNRVGRAEVSPDQLTERWGFSLEGARYEAGVRFRLCSFNRHSGRPKR
jgi:hypothetical protein